MNNPILVIIAKEPQVGTTKTRLSPPLSLALAAELFEALLDDTIELVSGIPNLDLAVAVTPPEATAYFENKTPHGTILLPVTCADIGDCLVQVFEQLFQLGYQKVIAFNSDGPSLPQEFIQSAITLLDGHDVVLGPSEDGGYYLIGLTEPHPRLFKGINWSTSEVLTQSLAITEAQNLQVTLLPEWYDVDTEADIKRLLKEIRTLPEDQLRHARRFFTHLPPELQEALSD